MSALFRLGDLPLTHITLIIGAGSIDNYTSVIYLPYSEQLMNIDSESNRMVNTKIVKVKEDFC